MLRLFKQFFLTTVAVLPLIVQAQVPVCDESLPGTISTEGLREGAGGALSTCTFSTFQLTIDPSAPADNIMWFKDGQNKGGGQTLNTSEAGVYQAINMNFSENTCVDYGSVEVLFGELPSVSIAAKTRFFCKDSAGAELIAVVDESLSDAPLEWFQNGQSIGESGDTITVDENSSIYVEVEDQGCVGRSEQIQIQEKFCDNIICPEIELNQTGLVQINHNTYRICDEDYSLSLTTKVGSLGDMYYTWIINGMVVSESSSYEGGLTGNVRVIVDDFLVCADTLDFIIESGDVSRVQILDKVDGEIKYCLKNEGAMLEAVAQPDLDFIYTWYVMDGGQYTFYADGPIIEKAPDGDYKVVIGTLECDEISSDEVTVIGFDCETNCFGLEIQSFELFEVNDTAFISCRNYFAMNLISSIGNIDQATVTWYFSGDEFATGKNVGVNKEPEDAEGFYKVVAEDVGVCIDELDFTISNDPIAEITILDGPVIEYCGTEQIVLKTEVEENISDANVSYYATWFKQVDGNEQNLGGGFEQFNPTAGVYKVELNGGSCTNIDSDEVEVVYEEECLAVGISQTNNVQLTVVPNPVTDRLSINGTSGSVQILSMEGKVLIASPTTKAIDVASLASGTYIIRIVSSTGVMTTSFVK